MITRTRESKPAIEMSQDTRFERRLERLVAVSLVFLGVITTLAWARTDADTLTLVLLVSGWILMPTLLYLSITNPPLRYSLAVPATLAIVGLLRIALDDATTGTGWWLITAGIVFGGTLGAWFWYRWAPVPTRLDDPFSPGRWALVAIHAGMIITGILLVLAQ